MFPGRRNRAVLAVCAIALLAVVTNAGAAPSFTRYSLANRCVRVGEAGTFFFKATRLGAYMLYGPDGKVLSVDGTDVERTDAATKASEWAPTPAGQNAFGFRSTKSGRWLAVTARNGPTTVGKARPLELKPRHGCKRFPEAQVDATGPISNGTNRDGTVNGFVDAHLHITADMRAGGRVIYGEAFDPFGIPAALGNDANVHGPDGSLDITGNLLRTGIPFGKHDTHGWPTFAGWPTYDTQTHQQTYYVWLERAWRAGLRLVVAQTVDDQAMCTIEPLRNDGCDETKSIKAQIRRLRGLQNYVDAQSGGPGRGWFRLVYSPAQARRVIERGKLAVIIGIESSDLFGCSERLGMPQCTRADVDRGVRAYKRLGVRSMFVAHWTDNAFAGAAIEGGAKGIFLNVFNLVQTGQFFKTGPCPGAGQGEEMHTLSPLELTVLGNLFPVTKPLVAGGMPTYPPGKQCNAKGLTALGHYAIRRLMANHMLIEVDHLSERARDTVLRIAKRHHYPLLSSHNGTGGVWTAAELRQLRRLGGFAAVTPSTARQLAKNVRAMARFKFYGVGIGTDTGGFASQPGPRSDAAKHPLRYPFRSFDGRVLFHCELTGGRKFNLNTDGVAHYGLIADLLADVRQERGRRVLAPVYRSAEGYLRTWQRAFRRR